MGRQVYLTDNEVRVLNEALSKWENWTTEDREEWEWDTLPSLHHKLYEGNMIKP